MLGSHLQMVRLPQFTQITYSGAVNADDQSPIPSLPLVPQSTSKGGQDHVGVLPLKLYIDYLNVKTAGGIPIKYEFNRWTQPSPRLEPDKKK